MPTALLPTPTPVPAAALAPVPPATTSPAAVPALAPAVVPLVPLVFLFNPPVGRVDPPRGEGALR